MASLLPMTELEAVNLMLESVGEQGISSLLTDTGNSYVSIASSVLHNQSRTLQTTGHSFNYEPNYTLSPDATTGFINVPTNTLKVKATDRTKKIVQRGNRLYDVTNHTFVFTADLLVDITFFLAFEDLPQAARSLIATLASRDFQKKVLGSDTLTSITAQDEALAWSEFWDEEADVMNPSIFDSYYTARPINRHANPVPIGGR